MTLAAMLSGACVPALTEAPEKAQFGLHTRATLHRDASVCRLTEWNLND